MKNVADVLELVTQLDEPKKRPIFLLSNSFPHFFLTTNFTLLIESILRKITGLKIEDIYFFYLI